MKLKTLFFILGAVIGFIIAYPGQDLIIAAAAGVALGVVSVLAAWALEPYVRHYGTKALLGAAVGIVAASFAFMAVNSVLARLVLPEGIVSFVSAVILLTLFNIAITVGYRKGKEIDQQQSSASKQRSQQQRTAAVETKILDTSVIIDGRIADVAEAGFITGPMIIPKFIIKELQHIADSSEPIKRVRGRRGLDVLKRMQKDIPNVSVKITNHDFPNIKEADLKLVELARRLRGIIITNDFNLNKVAGLQNVKVLNLNQLSNALKPVVLPGETMHIHVVKEGKEENQGVGYLEDGTMVVVDDARKYLGDEIDVSVTSVLQTPTGRMIFSRVKDDDGRPMVSDSRG
ncbi:MAG TPA: TRAM domain-containing protein [Thermodesulfobacteriota bacterium]|nr:TRAM domain-containing protein [Thermodesulfobacteriota bacterium]